MFYKLLLYTITCGQSLEFSRRVFMTSTATSTMVPKTHVVHTFEPKMPNRSFYFYGPVTEESCFYLSRALEECEESDTPIHLHIQSSGGHLLPTFNVVDTIQRIKSPVYTYVDGYAASAATLISVSGQKRYMGKHSLMLLHQLSGQNQGTYSYMKEEMYNMDTLMDFVKDVYLSHSKLNFITLKEILNYDNRWLNAESCLRYGLVDKII